MSIRTETKHLFSGVCVCGHPADQHHGNVVMNMDYYEKLQSSIYYGECEHFGCNEWWVECPECPGSFVDREDPLKEEKIASFKQAGLVDQGADLMPQNPSS